MSIPPQYSIYIKVCYGYTWRHLMKSLEPTRNTLMGTQWLSFRRNQEVQGAETIISKGAESVGGLWHFRVEVGRTSSDSRLHIWCFQTSFPHWRDLQTGQTTVRTWCSNTRSPHLIEYTQSFVSVNEAIHYYFKHWWKIKSAERSL